MRLFVVHAPEDGWFVRGFFLPSLGLPEHEVLLSSELDPGASIIQDLTRGAESTVTAVVVSPYLLASPWAQLASELAAVHSTEERSALVPVLLADCELSLVQRALVSLDFRRCEDGSWEEEIERLRRKLEQGGATVTPIAPPPPCPYPGMRAFGETEASRFYGREEELSSLVDRLRHGIREIYVIGPSGSGKSSLVRAGLLPRLADTPGWAGGRHLVRQMRPGADPAEALAQLLGAPEAPGELAAEASATHEGGTTDRGPVGESADAARWAKAALDCALARRDHHLEGNGAPQASRVRLMLFIDQLEELFAVSKPGSRKRFIAWLLALREDPRVVLVVTLRADFYAVLMESRLWGEGHGGRWRLDVAPLRGVELRRAIEAPAEASGVYFEPVLIERLLQEVDDEPGALPLLQDVLLGLWHRSRGALLRLSDYAPRGREGATGLAQAIAVRADQALSELSAPQRGLAQRVFLRLVHLGDRIPVTRRSQRRSELGAAGDLPNVLDSVIDHLATHRLLTISGGGASVGEASVDLAHEILLTAWPALVDWISAHRQDEQQRRALEVKAEEWVRSGRGQSRLLDLDELKEVRQWLARAPASDLGLSEDLLLLLRRSEEAVEAAVEAQREQKRSRLRWISLAVATLVGATIVGIVLVSAVQTSSQQANQQTLLANERSVEVGRQQQETALQRSEAARQRTETARQRAAKYILQAHSYLQTGQHGKAAPYLLAARELLENGGEPTSSILRSLFHWAAQGLPQLELVHRGPVRDAAWSPDGQRISTASGDGTARIWDGATGEPLLKPLAHAKAVNAVAWSDDGRFLATASDDRVAKGWDAVTGEEIFALHHEAAVKQVAWSPGRKWLATLTGANDVTVWNPATGEVILDLGHTGPSRQMSWSPVESSLAILDEAVGVEVWSISPKPELRRTLRVEQSLAMTWSPDGRSLAIGEGASLGVWDATTWRRTLRLVRHGKTVEKVSWSRGSDRIATAGVDGAIELWSAHDGALVSGSFHNRLPIEVVAWSPEGRRLATASRDGTAQIGDEEKSAMLTLQHTDDVVAVEWSPDGNRLVTASADGTAKVWIAPEAMLVNGYLYRRDLSPLWAGTMAWSPRGDVLAAASGDSTMRLWRPASEAALSIGFDLGKLIRTFAWSPDGTMIAAAGERTAQVWSADEFAAPETPPLVHQEYIVGLRWRPDGKQLATISVRGRLRVWGELRRGAKPILVHELEGVDTASWRPDGARLVIGGAGGAQVLDATSWEAVGPRLPPGAKGMDAVWSPDGRNLATSSRDLEVHIWNAATGAQKTPPLRHRAAVTHSVWSPDGRRVATASLDRTLRVWDAATGLALTAPLQHDEPLGQVVWSPDGQRILTTGYKSGLVLVWDAATGLTASPLLRQHWLASAVWAPDGKLVTAMDWAGQLRHWDTSEDSGSLEDWRAKAALGGYFVDDNGVLTMVLRAAAFVGEATAGPR